MLGFLKAFKNTSKDVEEIKINGWLDKSQVYGIYLLTDSKVCRVAKYFQEHGLHILSASSNISKIGGKFVMDIEPSILLLIDTGRGAYSNSKAQKELIDIIGAGDLSMNKARPATEEEFQKLNNILPEVYFARVDLLNELGKIETLDGLFTDYST